MRITNKVCRVISERPGGVFSAMVVFVAKQSVSLLHSFAASVIFRDILYPFLLDPMFSVLLSASWASCPRILPTFIPPRCTSLASAPHVQALPPRVFLCFSMESSFWIWSRFLEPSQVPCCLSLFLYKFHDIVLISNHHQLHLLHLSNFLFEINQYITLLF